ncbi:MAG: alpha-amylase family glycosyl hydrolase [Candidatus Cryptobacteroides sp.]
MKLKKSILLFALLGLFVACDPESTKDDPTPGPGEEIPVPDPDFDLSKLQPGLSSNPAIPSTEGACILYYKAGGEYPFSGYTEDIYAHVWIQNVSGACYVLAEWGTNTDKLRWQPTQEKDVWQIEVSPTVREWFGAEEGATMSKLGVVVRSADGKKQSGDLFVTLNDASDVFEPTAVEKASLPSGVQPGINYLSSTSVCLVLLEKDKDGKSYDHSFVVGDFNSWKLSNDCQMKRDEAAGCWWITLTGLEPGKEYRYQYHLTKGDDYVRIHDPYTEITYDGGEDKWIPASTYPNMPEFPKETGGILGAFQTDAPQYNWKVKDFKISDQNNLIIYELLLRDFSSSKDLAGCTAHLDYLQNLGINAIELMPVQEFDGNDSWGYNPRSYFALDKAYGTRQAYKEFIDECHSRGIAVILDVVYNHATGAHPMAKLYWDSSKNCTAENNPWFNVTAPHPFSVYHDWNHENQDVRKHIKRSLEYLLSEYKFDGFRFDLSKGFSQRKCNDNTCASYDQSRVDILKDYTNTIHAVNPNAVVILEHFCETGEEKVLGENGMKVWRNMNYSYCQTAMGWLSSDDLSGMWTYSSMPYGSLVGFMESHDEERTAYKAKTWGNGACKTDLSARVERLKLNAAFSMLVPGPKMIWQFGELGYDISIEEGGRTAAKPLHWEYYDDASRKSLYDTYASLLDWRESHSEFYTSSAGFSWSVGSGYKCRTMTFTSGSKAAMVAGNFDVTAETHTITLPSSGTYVEYGTNKEYNVGSDKVLNLGTLQPGEFRIFVKK